MSDPKALAEKIEEQVWGEKKTGLGVFFPTQEWHGIIAALRAQPDPGSAPVEGWLPIETAPKGVEVPCLAPEYDGPVMLKHYRPNGLDAWRDWDQDVYAPTHWFKLPPPPAEPSLASLSRTEVGR